MIDLSEGAFPAFADMDDDGDQDMLVGNDASVQHGSYSASISYYQNTGTAAAPAFTLVTDDFLNLSSRFLRSINPVFADINSDGAPDLILTYQQPEAGISSIGYIPNTAAKGTPMQFSFADIKTVMTVEAGDAPAFFDVDDAGDLDLVLGKAGGILPFYRNTGSASQPAYTLEKSSLNNIGLDAMLRNLRPAVADVDGDGQPDLLTVDDSGKISIYRNFIRNLNAGTSLTAETRLLENPLTGQLHETRLGKGLRIAVAPLGGANKLYMAIGMQGGGLYLLEQTAGNGTVTENPQEALTLQLYPNPADKATYDVASARASLPVSLKVYDAIGRLVYQTPGRYSRTHSIPLQNLKAGLYVVHATAQSGEQVAAKLLVR